MSLLTRMFRAPDPTEERDWSISDPDTVSFFASAPALSGVTVSESTVLGIPAVWRAVSTIASSLASLPLQTIVKQADGTSQRVPSFLDDPGRVIGLTAYEWKELILTHLLIHGNAFLIHIPDQDGQIVGLQPVHPSAVEVEVKGVAKRFRVTLANGSKRDYTDATLTHIPAISTDGVRGISPLLVAKNTFGTAIAADRSAAKLFGNGALMSAIVTPEDQLTEDQATAVKQTLDQGLSGVGNAGGTAVINRKLKITQWSLSAKDSQWIEARAFQVEEIARLYGIPPHLLAQTEKQTSWGTGVEQQSIGLHRYVLEPWSTRIQERLSWLLPRDRSAEFFYSAFVEPDTETEIKLLTMQTGRPFLTVNEARRIRNLPPIEGGDVLEPVATTQAVAA